MRGWRTSSRPVVAAIHFLERGYQDEEVVAPQSAILFARAPSLANLHITNTGQPWLKAESGIGYFDTEGGWWICGGTME